MDKRSDTSRLGYREDTSSHSKKSKKRSSKRSSVLGPWINNVQNNQTSDIMPGMEYQNLLWQSNVPQNFPNNGQRLFAAASDPSMCGYAQMPMTYTMEPVSLPTMYRLYQPVPFSGMKTVHGRTRRQCNPNHPINLTVNSMTNGYTSLQENGVESPVPVNCQNGDYASLPPTANKNSGINGEELNSEHRRYSDPGLGSSEAAVPTQSEESDSVDSGSSITTIGRGNKLVLSLIEQMTELKKSNSQLFKELSETKSELGSMKAKLAQGKYNSSTDYQPGMLADFIREIREANKTCEESLLAKTRSMMEEKLDQRSLEVNNLNNQVSKLLEEKAESDRRIAKLEEEVSTMKLNANNEDREIAAFEEETLALRRELQEARASKCLAENHVAKCVNARSITPVANFDTTQSYVTSTPVRTVLSDTCSLIPPPSSSPSSSSASNSSSCSSASSSGHFTSFLRSRTAEVAHRFVADKSKVYSTNVDCHSLTSMDSSSWILENQERSMVDDDGDRSPTLTASTVEIGREIVDGLDSEDSLKNLREDTEKIVDESLEEDEEEDEGKREETSKKETSVDHSLEKRMETSNVSADISAREKRTKGSKNRNKEEQISRGGSQRNSSKKNKKKGGGSGVKRQSFDRPMDRRTVSKDVDRNRLDGDDETSRAITDVPEVTVIGGGSFVPKDLCSTGILTSRVLTAPSRATYTTAYI